MSVARRLRIRPATTVVVVDRPAGVDLEIPPECLVVSDPADAATADAVVAFVVRATDLREPDEPDEPAAAPTATGAVLAAAREDRLAWLLYPKNRRLGSDLDRDLVAALLRDRGVQPVRQVRVDDVWTGLQLRPV